MTEHKSTSFAHSCIKIPVDPYSRQPTPIYERPRVCRTDKSSIMLKDSKRLEERSSKTSSRLDNFTFSDYDDDRGDHNTFYSFLDSLADCDDVYRRSNDLLKQRTDYLKRKQRILMKDMANCFDQDRNEDALCAIKSDKIKKTNCIGHENSSSDLTLKGKRCNLEESRTNSPLLYPSASFSCLAEDQDFLTYRSREREKAAKTRRNEAILSATKSWSSSESKSESLDSDDPEIRYETKSLPARSPKRWDPMLTKPFNFREEVEKYMSMTEQQAAEYASSRPAKKKKRRFRPVPLTSKIPLYDKLVAEKEARSRLVREESALSLMSQVRPFKLECDKRALRALTRSSPELSSKRFRCTSSRFRARPVPRSLFSTEIYDRMLEDEYFRNLQKRIRAAELLKTSSLPPSMARRERCKSAVSLRSSEERPDSVALSRGTSLHSERTRDSALTTMLPPHGTNLAAILRAQASREKLEREIQAKMEEKRREQLIRLRRALIGRKPAWRALRFAARHEHERDLDFRASLRRDEARRLAERHRLQMEMMLDRVTQIPTLFERYSQSYQDAIHLLHSKSTKQEMHPQNCTTSKKKKKKPLINSKRQQSSSSGDSYASFGSNSRPNSGSVTSSSGTLGSLSRSSGSGKSAISRIQSRSNDLVHKCLNGEKRKNDRGPLKVSINETAELIEDIRGVYDDVDNNKDETYSIDTARSQTNEECEKGTLDNENEVDKKE